MELLLAIEKGLFNHIRHGVTHCNKPGIAGRVAPPFMFYSGRATFVEHIVRPLRIGAVRRLRHGLAFTPVSELRNQAWAVDGAGHDFHGA